MTQEREPENAAEDIAYAYRPSINSAPVEFRLAAGGIDWDDGRKSGHVAYRSVRHLRLSYRPMSIQTHRFVTEIWAEGAPKVTIVSSSWKSAVEQERLDKPYVAFVTALHRRIAAAGAPVRCTQGQNPFRYWPGLLVFVLVSLALAATFAYTLRVANYGTAAVIAAFLALFLWQVGKFFRRNRPGVYRVDDPPADLIPAA
jgi:hypothetical protein